MTPTNLAHDADARRRWLRRGVATCVVAFGLLHVWHLRWIAEDAYISFRYARNLIEGHGLVFNVGEKVEGYTNFLWTLMLATGLQAGLNAPVIAIGCGLTCTALTLVGQLRLWRRLTGGEAILPAALLALAASYTWAGFGSSGLETSLLACLLTWIFVLLAEGPIETRRRRSVATCAGVGGLVALATMTRPDALLVLPAVLIFLGLGGEPARIRATRAGLVLLATALVYGPYFVWRMDYYGHVFPNTFYAREAALSHYTQGWHYLWEFARRYFLWALFPFPMIAVGLHFRRGGPGRALATALAGYCLLHTLYVVRVGGDFMEGRFFVPVLPFAYLLVESGLREALRNRVVRTTGLALLVLSTAVNRTVIPPGKIERGITDERSWMPVVERWLAAGAAFGKHLPPGTPIATDAVGAFGWTSRLPLIDTLGLTDEFVAHQALTRRSRPGHDKRAPVAYLQSRGVAVIRDGKNIYRTDRPPDMRHGGNDYYLTSRDPAVMQGFRRAALELAQRGR